MFITLLISIFLSDKKDRNWFRKVFDSESFLITVVLFLLAKIVTIYVPTQSVYFWFEIFYYDKNNT